LKATYKRCQFQTWSRQTDMVRACCLSAILVALASIWSSDFAQSKDLEDDDASTSTNSTLPNIYLDLRTNYAAVPANALSVGFGSPSLSSMVGTLSPSSSQGVAIDVPLTVDIGDRLSVYGGFSASASQGGASDWSTLAVSSWNAGFQVDVHQQNGGTIPTITLQSTLTRSVPDSPLATTSLNTIVEFGYALNSDETRGFLAGIQHTRIAVDSPLATVKPASIGYVGAYYQWENNWKITGRVGVQSFGGAQLLNLTPIPSFTQPIVRLDLDRLDDNDNRLFGLTAQIVWVPRPSYQITIRTPLYAFRN